MNFKKLARILGLSERAEITIVLTPPQALVLITFEGNLAKSFPQIAVDNRLVPREARNLIETLVSRQLLKPVAPYDIYRLTDKGRRTVKRLKNGLGKVQIISPEEITPLAEKLKQRRNE